MGAGRSRAFKGCERGAAAVEFALLALAFILLCLAILEFGRGWQVRNELAFAADFGARSVLTDATIPDSVLEEEVRAALTLSDPARLEVMIGRETVEGVEFRSISVSYPFTLLLPSRAGDVLNLEVVRRTPVT